MKNKYYEEHWEKRRGVMTIIDDKEIIKRTSIYKWQQQVKFKKIYET